MTLQLRKAERKKAKLRIGLGGPAGSGKTYSALLMANGMAPWEKIAMIDTENGSGELYSDLGPYNVITITPPFTPEVYIEAIKVCEKAGIEVIVIDSITHEWDGQGGCLEIVDKLGGKYQDWGKVTPRHKAFIDSILQSSCHIITSVRKKQDYDMVKTSDGKTKVEKLGMKEITREGFEYELTLNFELMINHYAKASKDRTGLFMERPEFIISQITGKELLDWANSGAEPSAEEKLAERTKELKKEILNLLVEMVPEVNWKIAKAETYKAQVKQLCDLELVDANLEAVVEKLKVVRTQRQQQTEETLAQIEEMEKEDVQTPAPTPEPAPVAQPEAKNDPVADALGLDPKDIPQTETEEESAARKRMKEGLNGFKQKDDNQF